MRAPWMLSFLVLAACDSASSSSSCQLTAQASGAVQWQSQADPACLIPFGSPSGIAMLFKPLSGDVATFEVEVGNIMVGQTGAFPAKVEVDLRDGRKWATTATGCTVTLDEDTFQSQDQFHRKYQTAGHGECQETALALAGASGSLTIALFTFRFPASF